MSKPTGTTSQGCRQPSEESGKCKAESERRATIVDGLLELGSEVLSCWSHLPSGYSEEEIEELFDLGLAVRTLLKRYRV